MPKKIKKRKRLIIRPSSPFPPQEHLESIKWGNYIAPINLPAYLETIIDPINNMEVTRIAEEAAFSIGDVIEKRNAYSKRQVFNSDQSYILLGGNAPKLLNGSTYTLLATIASGFIWSNRYRLKVYQSSSNEFRRRTLNENTYIVSTDSGFPKIFSDYTNMNTQTNETNISNDDKYVALYGDKVSTGTDCWVLVYDIENETTISETNLGTPLSNIDWVSISQSGNFVVVQHNTNGSGANQGVKSYDRNMNNEQHLIDGTPHGDLGFDMRGKEVYVHYGSTVGNTSLGFTNLTTGITTSIWNHTATEGNRGLYGGHISCRNIRRPGWAYITESESTIAVDRNEAYLEIDSVRLDSYGLIERWGKTNARESNSKEHHQGRGVPSPHGNKVVFGSDWDDTALRAKTYAPAWIVKRP